MNTQKYNKYKKKEIKNVYSNCQITKIIILPFTSIGNNLLEIIENNIASIIEGKCIVEGFVKKKSVKVLTFSSGLIKGNNIEFNVVFNCLICFPVPGMLLNCIVKNITKAGIRAESIDEQPSPFIMFISRDHFYSNTNFNSVEENDKIITRVIAQRFELNDEYISIIGELVS